MPSDTDALLESITDIIPKLLMTMESFEQVQANAHPGRYDQLAGFVAPYASELATSFETFSALEFPDDVKPLGQRISQGITYALRACDNIANHAEGMGKVMQAMRAQCRAQELIYPLAPFMTPVSQYFLELPARTNKPLMDALAKGSERDAVGLHEAQNARDSRGGFSLYIPENLPEDQPAPLVIALHGGTGHGADFLWSWVREARTRGFIVLAPTSQQDTWSLMGEEYDLAALQSMLAFVKSTWPIDERHILLTGMSDGATYAMLAGLKPDSPFTHLAPFSGVLHPEISMGGAIIYAKDKPIYLVHGTLDWMFPLETAWMARDELERAGAALKYREIDGLSHAFARKEIPALMEWFNPDLHVPGQTG